VTQLEDCNSDVTGFPPDLTAPIRPAVPRRTGQLPLGAPDRADPSSPLCSALRSPLSSPLGSPMIDVDDDLDELELDDRDADDLGDDGDDRGAPPPEPNAPVALGRATLGDRARRLGARFAHKVLVPVAAIAILVIAMGGTWTTAGATPATLAAAQPGARTAASPGAPPRAGDEPEHAAHGKAGHHELTGKLNLNTATEDQLMVLPSVGPAKADRIVTWRKKNGGFKRTADLRRVKGFGYKTFKKLEPYLDIKGDTTLAPK